MNQSAQQVGTGSQVAAWIAIVILGLTAVVLIAANWSARPAKSKGKGKRR